MNLEVITLSIGLVASAGAAVGFAVRVGGLRVESAALATSLRDSQKEHEQTAAEFAAYQTRATQHREALLDDITDLEDNLEACSDPDVLRDQLGRLLQKAAGRDGNAGDDGLPGDGG